MKLNLNLDPLKLGPFELDLADRTKGSIAERIREVPAAVAEKVRESQVGPICISATIGFLAGVAIGLVLSPVKNGINILSNNDLHTEEGEEKPGKKPRQPQKSQKPVLRKKKNCDYTVTNHDDDEEALSV
ncbi:MAG: hypothetical protein IKN55_07555 [Oscillospiraceae bacterium]|nr:hypothetical protein [Oscillospiraceae bacterium]